MHLTHTPYMPACQVCTCEGWHNTCSSAHYTCLSHNTVHLSVYHDTWQAVLYKATAHMQCTCYVNARGVNCNTRHIQQQQSYATIQQTSKLVSEVWPSPIRILLPSQLPSLCFKSVSTMNEWRTPLAHTHMCMHTQVLPYTCLMHKVQERSNQLPLASS